MTAQRSNGTPGRWRGPRRRPSPPRCGDEVLLVFRRPDGRDLGAPAAGLEIRLDLAETPTAGGAADPALPVLVLDAPATDAEAIKVRAVGVIHADRTVRGRTLPCACLVAVALGSRRLAGLGDLNQLAQAEIEALERAWAAHNLARCAGFQIIATHGAGQAAGPT